MPSFLVNDNPAPDSVSELEERLSRPTPGVLARLADLQGDLVVLGAGGKMGFGICRMARRAFDALGRRDRVWAVSRFARPQARNPFHVADVETIPLDLLCGDLATLPDARLVVSLVGHKFGASTDPAATWAVNAGLPPRLVKRYSSARIVMLSTGNVYGLTPAGHGGSREEDAPAPVGEYAMSCLGRERLVEHASRTLGARVILLRLNYASDLRYGVMVDLAGDLQAGREIDLSMGYFNTLWQGTANAWTLQALSVAASPAEVLNITGPEELSVRQVARDLATRLGRSPRFAGTEAPTALLSNPGRAIERWGPPEVDAPTLLEWTASWVERDLPRLDKPTRFQSREGAF